MSTPIYQPYPTFNDLNGSPLETGYIYIGTVDGYPPDNEIEVWWDKDLTIAATQPIRTIAGYAAREGSPAVLYIGVDNYSILVLDKNRRTVYYSEDASTGFAPINSPHFTGVPTAPTAAAGTNTTQIATTAFVNGYLPLAGGTITGSVTFEDDIDVAGNATFDNLTATGAVALPAGTTIDGLTLSASGRQAYFTPGSYTFVAKSAITYVTGAAGGGGGASGGSGCGGGADACILFPLATVVGQSYTVNVGAAGSPDGAGGATTFGVLLSLSGGQAASGSTDGGSGGARGSAGQNGFGGGSLFAAPASQGLSGRLYGGGGCANQAGGNGFLVLEW